MIQMTGMVFLLFGLIFFIYIFEKDNQKFLMLLFVRQTEAKLFK